MENPAYTRRQVKKLTPEVLGQFHALIMNQDVQGFENLLEKYNPYMSEQVIRQMTEMFKHYAARVLSSHWRPSK